MYSVLCTMYYVLQILQNNITRYLLDNHKENILLIFIFRNHLALPSWLSYPKWAKRNIKQGKIIFKRKIYHAEVEGAQLLFACEKKSIEFISSFCYQYSREDKNLSCCNWDVWVRQNYNLQTNNMDIFNGILKEF